MKVLALIPARGGSKRIPRKNIRDLGGKPLIAWSIEAARAVPGISDILVSTDDQEIADLSLKAGALVPWLRPAELATDNASSIDVVLHALDSYQQEHGEIDGILLLQPTSPFRSPGSISEALRKFREDPSRPVVGMSYVTSHPAWCFWYDGTQLEPCLGRFPSDARSQELRPVMALNGAIYLATPAFVRSRRTFVSVESVPLIMPREESIDIDDEFDWSVATAIQAAGLVRW